MREELYIWLQNMVNYDTYRTKKQKELYEEQYMKHNRNNNHNHNYKKTTLISADGAEKPF